MCVCVVKALRHFLRVSEVEDSDSINLAITTVGKARDPELTRICIDFLMGEHDGMPKVLCWRRCVFGVLGTLCPVCICAVLYCAVTSVPRCVSSSGQLLNPSSMFLSCVLGCQNSSSLFYCCAMETADDMLGALSHRHFQEIENFMSLSILIKMTFSVSHCSVYCMFLLGT